MSKEIAVGTTVTDYSGGQYRYGGPSEHGAGWNTIEMNLLARVATIKCDADSVIPSEFVTEPDVKDSRITALNDKVNKPRSANGPWKITTELAAGPRTDWAKTKRDGLKNAAMRLQIEDWHNEAPDIKERLEYLRGQINAESISYGEIAELQILAKHIEAGDVQLLEWAGEPEQ